MPELAPEPAKPMKFPEAMLLANREAPTFLRKKLIFKFYYIYL
jgi:hypothetical protein